MQDNQIEKLNDEIEQQLQGEDAQVQEEQVTGGESSEEERSQTEAQDDTNTSNGDNEEITVDGLEIPKPDIENKTNTDYVAERMRYKREREERKARELQQEQIRKDQEEIIRIKAEQAALQTGFAPPSRDDYGSDGEFVEATINYTIAKRQIQEKVASDERARFTAQQRLMDQVNDTKNKGSAKYSDFDDVVEPLFDRNGDVPNNIALVDAINASPYGADILYLLGKNKKKAIEVASMHPRDAMKWVWQTEQKYEKAKAKVPVAPGVKVMPKVTSKLTPYKDIGSMTTKEYTEYWKKTRFSD